MGHLRAGFAMASAGWASFGEFCDYWSRLSALFDDDERDHQGFLKCGHCGRRLCYLQAYAGRRHDGYFPVVIPRTGKMRSTKNNKLRAAPTPAARQVRFVRQEDEFGYGGEHRYSFACHPNKCGRRYPVKGTRLVRAFTQAAEYERFHLIVGPGRVANESGGVDL